MHQNTQSQLLNLYSMVIADASSDPKELAFLFQWARDHGIEAEALQEVILNPQGISFIAPADTLEAIGQLYDLTQVVIADGVIQEEERQLLATFARRFGFAESVIAPLITQLLYEVQTGRSKAEVLQAAKEGMTS